MEKITNHDMYVYETMDNKPEMVFSGLFVEIPIKVHNDIKARASKHNITLRKWVLRAILRAIKDEQQYE